MHREDAGTPGREPPEGTRKSTPAAGPWLARAFPWHARAFVALNVVLSLVNALTGPPWWAFWPLAATGFILTVHYLFYKAAAIDERWVDERVEELNLKSYDRSHIEDLKRRHGAGDTPEDHRA